MHLPFSIDKYYTTNLTREKIYEELIFLTKEKSFGGLRTDKFYIDYSDEGFSVVRSIYGLDIFTIERYPAIKGYYIYGTPTTININIKPNYFILAFCSIFFFSFLLAAILLDKMTINGVFRTPSIAERLFFAAFGIAPGIWGYFGIIRPVKKAEKWIVEKLELTLVTDEKNHY